MKKILLSMIAVMAMFTSAMAQTIDVKITWPADAVDVTGAEAVEVSEGIYAVGNNSKATLTSKGFYTGGNSSASARYMYYTPEYDGTLSVEGTASGDNTDRYVFIATEAGADETASTVVASAAIPEKGVRHTATADVKAGTTYYLCLHGNGTITNVTFSYVKTLDKSALAAKIAEAKALNNEALAEDIAAASDVYDTATTQEEVDAAVKKLDDAIGVFNSINTVSVSTAKVAKAMVNGKVVVVKGAKQYNVAGQEL